VFAIIGAVLAAVQVIVASAGANRVQRLYGDMFVDIPDVSVIQPLAYFDLSHL